MPDVEAIQRQPAPGDYSFRDLARPDDDDHSLLLDVSQLPPIASDCLLSPDPPYFDLLASAKMDGPYLSQHHAGPVDDSLFPDGQACYSSAQHHPYRTMQSRYSYSSFSVPTSSAELFTYQTVPRHQSTPALTADNPSSSPSVFGEPYEHPPPPYTSMTEFDFHTPAYAYPDQAPEIPPLASIAPQRTFAPSHETRDEPLSSKERLSCDKCNATFNRPADLQRHTDSTHRKSERILKGELIDCPWPRCKRRGAIGFGRHDHLLEHRRGFHKEFIPKRGRTRRAAGSSAGVSKPAR